MVCFMAASRAGRGRVHLAELVEWLSQRKPCPPLCTGVCVAHLHLGKPLLELGAGMGYSLHSECNTRGAQTRLKGTRFVYTAVEDLWLACAS